MPTMPLFGGLWIFEVLVVSCALFVFFYFWLTATYGYWKKKNVPYIQPSFPFGNFGKLFRGKTTASKFYADLYKQFKPHGFGGVHNMRTPLLVICNPDLIRHVLTKDFDAFSNRFGYIGDEKHDSFSTNLFSLNGRRWKTLRFKLTPSFSSGKVKEMFPLIEKCYQDLDECIRNKIKDNNGSIDMRELLERFCVDVIGTCAFGIECNSFKNPDGEFYKVARSALDKNLRRMIRFSLVTMCPKLSLFFTFKRMFPKLTVFFTELMERTVKYRKKNNVRRNDFVQLMMKIMEEDSTEFNLEIMTAQAFVFFLAGVQNIAITLGFCLHAMAVDTELQERVYEQVNKVMHKFIGKMTYEALGHMGLVTRVLDEGLRLYTPSSHLMRVCTVDKYEIPGTDIQIDRDVQIAIPMQCLHRDEEFFPNPDKFDPDRFTESEKAKRHPYAYMPFGEGPRSCIASHFAKVEMRLCFAELIRNFRFDVAMETDLSLDLDSEVMFMSPKNGFWLRVLERNR